MSIKIEAKDLESAYIKAANELGCSAMNLEITPIRVARKGIFGFFQKDGLFEVTIKKDIERAKKAKKSPKYEKNDAPQKPKNSEKSSYKNEPRNIEAGIHAKAEVRVETGEKKDEGALESTPKPAPKKPTLNIDSSIFDAFHRSDEEEKPEPLSKEQILSEIRAGLDKMFSLSCFDIEITEVSFFDDETIFIKLDGADAALMIGKEGYRYKAISYLLFNWINAKYNKGIRLEIAEFLHNQEMSVAAYLQSVIERVEITGRAQTKPLDGVLVKIALGQLRDRFPDKYVGIKSSEEGKFIVINDFYKK